MTNDFTELELSIFQNGIDKIVKDVNKKSLDAKRKEGMYKLFRDFKIKGEIDG